MPIFDQGYQHWSGTLSGYTWRWYTITRHGIRVAMKNMLLRILVIVSWLPAAILVGALCEWSLLERKSPVAASPLMGLVEGFPQKMLTDPQHYRVECWTICFNRFFVVELYFAMLVVLLVGPGLISLDLRFNALPLYFSRSLRRIDYFVGKLGVIAWFLTLVLVVPSLIAYTFGLLFSLDITILRDTYPLLLSCLAYSAVIVLSAGTLILALSSLSRNSRYVALFWVVLWFVSGSVGLLLDEANAAHRRSRMYQKQAEVYNAQVNQAQANRPMTPAEMKAQMEAREEWNRRSRAEFEAEENQAAQSNWRPLLSYTGNVSRLGHLLLNTDAARRQISTLVPDNERFEYLLENLGPQYPWYWSAIVLTILFGLSVCLLNYRVRSLDRLK